MEIPKYPDGFFDFKDGVDISNETINEWIRDCINYLEQNPDEESTLTASGNTQVTVFRDFYEDNPELNHYEVMVTKNYRDADVWVNK